MEPEFTKIKSQSEISNKYKYCLFLLPITILLLLTTILFAYKYYHLRNEINTFKPDTSEPQNLPLIPTPTINPINKWKSYNNDKFGFIFEYPQDWLNTENAENNIISFSDNNLTNSTQSALLVTVLKPDARNRQKVIDDYRIKYPEYGFQKLDIGGYDAIGWFSSPQNIHTPEIIIIQPFGGYSVEFKAINSSGIKYISMITDTFRIKTDTLKNIEISDWILYQDIKNRFTIRLPQDWIQVSTIPLKFANKNQLESDYGVEIEVRELDKSLSVKELILADVIKGNGDPQRVGFWDMKVDGINTFIAFTAATPGLPRGIIETSYIPFENVLYIVRSVYAGHDPDIVQSLQVNIRGILKNMVLKCGVVDCI